MRTLADAGVTVLVSSHLLGEIQLICDHVTIIARGRRVAAGPVDDVLAGTTRTSGGSGWPSRTRAAELLRRGGADGHGHRRRLLMVGGVAGVASDQQHPGRSGLWVRELTPITAGPGECVPRTHRHRPAPQPDGTTPDDAISDEPAPPLRSLIELDRTDGRRVDA